MHAISRLLIVCALLCTLASSGFAQDDQTLYLQLSYMKSTSPDYVAVEQNIFKPIHDQRVKDGELESWAVYYVAFGDRTEYDYVVASVYRGLERVGNQWPDWEGTVGKAHPGKSPEEIFNKAGSNRENVRTELWELVSEVEGSPMVGSHLYISYVQSTPGMAGRYRTVEDETWTPMNAEWIRLDPFRVGHKFFALREPGGTSQAYNFAIWQTFEGRGKTDVTWRDALEGAYPEKDVDALGEEVLGLRTVILSQTWQVVAHAGK